MPKTQAEIDALKLSWREDPTWDIEDAEGFEDHRGELAEYRLGIEAKAEARAAKQHKAARDRMIEPARACLAATKIGSIVGPSGISLAAVELLLRLAAEMLLPLQRQLERQAEDIEAMQRRHEDELDALRRRIGGQ